MANWKDKITENQLYLIVIISVASLIIVNQFVAQNALDSIEEKEYATFITGELATESQKLETLSFRAIVDTSYFKELKNETRLWYDMAIKMEESDSRLHLNKADTERVQIHLDKLHQKRDELYKMINTLESPEDLALNINKIVNTEDQFNAYASELYNELELISENEVSYLRKVELIIALISLLLLLFEFQFVIRPVMKELKKKKESLEALNKSKDRILATVAHDIRNPLSGIEGLLTIFAEEAEDLTEEQEEYINLCLISCKKAESLIQELLDISLLESEEYHLDTELIHLEQYLKGVLTQFNKKAEEKDIELRIKIDPEHLKTKIDKNQFSRVIENIVGNAIKFTEHGEVELYSKDEGDDVIIEIRDTGIGIPDKLKDFIFDKFSKARRLGTKGEVTTGLGMSIVKTIVEKHDGKIWLESEEGKGTVFYISIPKKT
jgi:signal transduction histidine kinase